MILEKITHALHHLFNPHCEICKIEHDEESEAYNDQLIESREFNSSESEKERAHLLQLEIERKRCYSCEVLERQLAEANSIIRTLLAPKESIEQPDFANLKPITPKKNWAIIRRELEAKDRELAKNLRENKDKEISVDSLESELENIKGNA